ncbi:hypothetical protein CDD81_4781 [Ophiocordyceps australis]|uniref:NADH:flavin oxidoreductase/NADH oxidase N-terminal domain-containing protein n=1 Tax=Ophiocordyceps australis TaxID=1399860 RepID=A0A2C5Y6G8_9HYPO|nr:hypothetical protein CDD81_4781 [Ophiocordyceps australis]
MESTPTPTPQNDQASPLAKPLNFVFSGKSAKNRLLKAAMTERISSWDAKHFKKRGVPSKALINLYRRWGQGGYGIILTGNIMIDHDQLECPGNSIIPPGAPFHSLRFNRFKELAREAKRHGSLVIGQVNHPGRQVEDYVQRFPLSASNVQLVLPSGNATYAKPRAMEQADIDNVIAGFAHAAEYLYKAGFDGIQIHAAHGYLLAQFLSLTTNKRTDQYGGSLSNRARLIFEISDAIKARVPSTFIVSIKLNSVEFQPSGFTFQECKDLSIQLEHHGFDFIEISGGTFEKFEFKHKRESTRKREAFFLEFAEMILPCLHQTRVYVTGGLRSAAAMAEALATVDGIGIGRPCCHEPDIGQKLLSGTSKSAASTLIGSDELGIDILACGAQMGLISLDKQPLDFGREDHYSFFKEEMAKHVDSKANDPRNFKSGCVKIENVELNPYGTPYATLAAC